MHHIVLYKLKTESPWHKSGVHMGVKGSSEVHRAVYYSGPFHSKCFTRNRYCSVRRWLTQELRLHVIFNRCGWVHVDFEWKSFKLKTIPNYILGQTIQLHVPFMFMVLDENIFCYFFCIFFPTGNLKIWNLAGIGSFWCLGGLMLDTHTPHFACYAKLLSIQVWMAVRK